MRPLVRLRRGIVLVAATMVVGGCGGAGVDDTGEAVTPTTRPEIPPSTALSEPVAPAVGPVVTLSEWHLVYTTAGGGDPEIALVWADGEGHEVLSANECEELTPAWAPDGASIAYAADHVRRGSFDIHVMTVTGNEWVQITDHGGMTLDPAWSPDGNLIAYVSAHEGTFAVYVIPRLGGEPVRLTKLGSNAFGPAWSPDGGSIIYSSDAGGTSGIWMSNLDGSEPRRVFDWGRSDEWDPAWSPDGRWVAFASDRTGDADLYVAQLGDADAVRVTTASTADVMPTWSPDGRWLAFAAVPSDGANPLISVVAASGGEVITIAEGRYPDFRVELGAREPVALPKPLTTTTTSTTTTSTTTTTVPTPDGVVASPSLNVRDGPGTNHDRLTSLGGGDEVGVIGRDRECGWVKVVTPEGEVGWVAAAGRYLTLNVSCEDLPLGTYRPINGAFITDARVGSGKGQFEVENGTDRDAIVALVDRGDVVAAVFIRAGREARVYNVPDGSYQIFHQAGHEYDPVAKRLTADVTSRRFDDVIEFQTTSTSYSVWSITLHAVAGGSATTSPAPFPTL